MLWLEETDSTQRILKESSLPFYTVVVAKRQKRGKGRKGRRWESPEGGLYFSFVLREEDFSDLLPLPLVMGFSVVQALEDVGIKTLIKWPNDVYLSGKKLCGILTEKSSARVVVGIGWNLNQETMPESLQDIAISLRMATGRFYDPKEVLLRTLSRIYENLLIFQREGFAPFKEKVEERLLFLGQEVVIIDEKPIIGILEGIDERGFLLLKTSEGLRKVVSGDVSLRIL